MVPLRRFVALAREEQPEQRQLILGPGLVHIKRLTEVISDSVITVFDPSASSIISMTTGLYSPTDR